MQLSDFLDAGITTAVGVLGTDTVTRSQVSDSTQILGCNLSWANIAELPVMNVTQQLMLTLVSTAEGDCAMPHSLLLSLGSSGTCSL